MELSKRFYKDRSCVSTSGAGKESDTTIHLPAGVQEAHETNLIEKPAGDLAVTNNTVTIHTKLYEIKTVLVKFANP